MAKADDTSSTIDWIWLAHALRETLKDFGTRELAEARLKEWLATGQLRWTCMAWEELDATPRREDEPSLGSILSALILFWSSRSLWIDCEDNKAGDLRNRALGIKVSHTDLRALLPDGRPEHEEPLRQPAPPKLMAPKAWLANVRKKNPRRQNEDQSAYARRLHALMQEANLTKHWSPGTLLRRLYDK